jgi:hypothetical protein
MSISTPVLCEAFDAVIAVDDLDAPPTPSVTSVLDTLLGMGCPCRFPRFVYVVGSDFHDFHTGPVSCHDTENLVRASHYGSSAFLEAREPWRDVSFSGHRSHKCRVCGADWELISDEYSIDMYRSYLALRSRHLPDLGAEVLFPFPIAGGFRGVDATDIQTCAQGFTRTQSFKRTPLDEVLAYLARPR